MNIPAILILSRILLIPVFLILFFCGYNIPATIVFTTAALTDLFDGIIARKFNQVTNFYTFMDPLADKLLICSALIAMVQTHQLAAWFVILIVCRDFIITGFRLFAATQNKVLGAVITGKFNTFGQMLLIILILIGMTEPVINALIYIIVVLTIVSTAENFIRNKNVLKQIRLK